MINMNLDWENRPVSSTLTHAEHLRRLEVFEEQALRRKREAEAAEAQLVAAALLLVQRAR